MARSVLPLLTLAAGIVALSGCGVVERPQRPAWRAQAENICLSQKRVRASAYIQPTKAIDGPSICGLEHPFVLTALQEGAVAIKGQQALGCPMIAALDQWLAETVQPAAMKRFGQPVVELISVHTFACRPANNRPGARLSEHSFGNASDIGGFKLGDGRQIIVVRDWSRGGEDERAFLREAIAGACDVFTTVLGPGYPLHDNHFHLDLAEHGRTNTGPRRICKPHPGPQNAPQIRDNLPASPDIEPEEDMEIAQARPRSAPNRALALGQLDASVPATPVPRPAQARVYNPYALTPPGAVANAPRPLAPRAPASIREDGAFVPEGDLAEWDITGSIKRRK